MARKSKKQYSRTKHQHIETDDGWTHVVRGPSMKMANSNSKAASAAEVQKLVADADFERLEDMLAAYKRWKKDLADHHAVKMLCQYLYQQLTAHAHVKVSHVLCLGLGHFTRSWQNGSMQQLVLLEFLIDVLKQQGRIAEPVHIYFQDPAFSDLDMEFLRALSHSVIPWPLRGYRRNENVDLLSSQFCKRGVDIKRNISNSTDRFPSAPFFSDEMFLYTPHIELHTAETCFDIAKPALYLGHSLPWMKEARRGKVTSDIYSFLARGAHDPDARSELQIIEDHNRRLQNIIDLYDCQEPVQLLGKSHQWYNEISFAVKKSHCHSLNGTEVISTRQALGEYKPITEIKAYDDARTLWYAYSRGKLQIMEGAPFVDLWETLDAVRLAHSELKITEVVCLGLGSLSVREDVTDIRKFEQLAFLEQAVHILIKHDVLVEEPPVYIQDPRFTEVDVEMLENMEMSVVLYPQVGVHERADANTEGTKRQKVKVTRGGDLHCSDHLSKATLLYCPHLPRAVLEEIIGHVRPALYLGPKQSASGDTAGHDGSEISKWAGKAKWYPLKSDAEFCKDFELAVNQD